HAAATSAPPSRVCGSTPSGAPVCALLVTVPGRVGNTVLDEREASMAEYRIEHDSMGDVRVPVDARWGAQTQRALENFPISGDPVDPRVIRALALIKREAAAVNASRRDVPVLNQRVADAIMAAPRDAAARAS